MSAPSIPNLLSLRGRGGGRGDRGRGRGRGRGSGPPRGSSAISHDATIQGTDTDAAVSRMSAVELGYLNDPFAKCFAPTVDGGPARRLPIINRGTYTRTSALDTLVESFLSDDAGGSACDAKQIISLGAGTDTRALRLFSTKSHSKLIYHEIDYAVVCQKKLRIIQGTPSLARILGELSQPGQSSSLSWYSKPSEGCEYHCHGMDLRQTSTLHTSEDTSSPSLESIPGLRADIPTLLLSECCLCYLTPPEASCVLRFFIDRIPNLAVAIYEPIRPDDAFGRMMVSNLATRNISMPTVDIYREGKDQEARLQQIGFERVRHMTVEDIWDRWIGPDERERVDRLEGLDEVEEWKLLAAHYVIVWASKGAAGFGPTNEAMNK